MTTDLMSKTVLVLCDFDALYAAIELQLSRLLETRLIRLEPRKTNGLPEQRPAEEFDLMIVATVAPTVDPVSTLARVSLLDRLGKTPVLIISEQPSRPESDDKFTFLNFPFDIDQLPATVKHILDEHSPAAR
jgi:hypothetical protein